MSSDECGLSPGGSSDEQHDTQRHDGDDAKET